MSETRPIYEIAADIRKNWSPVYYAAVPYLKAMQALDTIEDPYFNDSGREIVLRFLCNAGTFRGPVARLLKAELKALVMPSRSPPRFSRKATHIKMGAR